jgi:hypothetical protein
MKTNDFIQALAADLPTKPLRTSHAIASALATSLPFAVALLYGLGVRGDFWHALTDPRFVFKFVFTLSAVAVGVWLALHLSRPIDNRTSLKRALGLVAAVLIAGVGTELMALPKSGWMPALVGDAALQCVVLIPLLSAAPLAAVMYAMKVGAPASPGLAGAAGGLLSGALGATLYATHCVNDSPLFVAVWYVLGILVVTALGSLLGSRILRW